MIFSSWFFKDRLTNNEFSILNRVDNTEKRLFVGKTVETFGVWYQYVRRAAPSEHIVMFCCGDSPIPIEEGLKYITEPYEFINDYNYNPDIKFHIKTCSLEITGPTQFPTVNPITRDILDGLVFAYKTNNNFVRLDCDCFLNSNLDKYTKGYDFFSTNINHQQFCGS